MHHRESDQRDQSVVDPAVLEVDAEPVGAGYAAQSVFAAGKCRPAEGNRIRQRGERECEQRKIDAAAAQHEKSDDDAGDGEERKREQRRPQHGSRKPVPLRERRRIRAEPEPGAVAEGDEPGMANQHIERHARDGKDHHIGGAGHRQSAREQRERQHDHRHPGQDDGRAQRNHSKR